MAAIVRIKRRRNEDPVESLHISCKRRKPDNPSASDISGVLKFAGTVPLDETKISSYIRDAIRKDKLQREYKSHGQNIEFRSAQRRDDKKRHAQSNRYKVTASRRAPQLDRLDSDDFESTTATSKACTSEQDIEKASAGDSSNGQSSINERLQASSIGDAASDKVFCLYDVEEATSSSVERQAGSAYSDITCNDTPLERRQVSALSQTDNDYVYDLYYTNSQNIDFHMLQDILTVEAYGDEMVFADSRAADDEYIEVYDDEDDSNEEDNWRNDYPDEDPRYIEGNGHAHYYKDEDSVLDSEDPLASYMASSCNIREAADPNEDMSTDLPAGAQRSYQEYYRAMLYEHGEIDADDDDSSSSSDSEDDIAVR